MRDAAWGSPQNWGPLVILRKPQRRRSSRSSSSASSISSSWGLRYMPTESEDISLNWTHLNATDSASYSANFNQFVGPPYSVGPPAGQALINGTGNGSLQTTYD